MKTRDLTDDERRELDGFFSSCNREQRRIVESTEFAFIRCDFNGVRRGWADLAESFRAEKAGIEERGIVGTLYGWRKVIA